jgi:tetratricopeptide (TPR) repeat protein
MALERLLDTEQRLTISEPYWPVESHPSLPAETSLSLQSIIAVTDHELSLEARTAFYALAIFPPKPNSFSEEAALAVTACTTQTLDALSDVGLVESSGSGRYTLHQAIADYAHLHLDTGLFATSRNRLIAYIANFVKTHKKDYELLELESNTIRAALDLAYELELTAPLVQLVCACAPFLILRGLYLLAEKYLKRAYAIAQSLNDSSSIAEILLYLGETAQHKGDYVQAEAYLQEGLASARQVNNSEHMCALLTDLGGIARRRGNYVQAEAYLQEGLTLARQIGDSERASVLLSALGTLMNELGNYTQAEIYLQNGLKLMRVFGDREQISTLLCNLGVMLGQQGKYQQAEKYFRESLELAHQIGYRELVALLLVNLGDAISKQGNYVQAETYLQEGLEVARQIGHREWTCALLMNLAEIARAQTRYTQAEKYLQEGLSIAQQIGRLRMLLYATYEYGNLSLSRGQIEAAEEKYRAVLAAIVTGDQDLLGLAQYGLAQVAASRQDTQKARQYGEASVNILVGMGHEKAQEVKRWLESLPE